MDDEFGKQLLERLTAIEQRLDTLAAEQSQLREAYARSRAHLRRLWLRPPMWTFEQHPPRPLDLSKLPAGPALPKQPPRIAIVTPSFNHGRFLRATIDSVLHQDYPRLFYHVQDCASADETVDILKSYGERISWRSEADGGQSDAINRGFQSVDCDIMAYLNSDDTLLPGTLACVANFFDGQRSISYIVPPNDESSGNSIACDAPTAGSFFIHKRCVVSPDRNTACQPSVFCRNSSGGSLVRSRAIG